MSTKTEKVVEAYLNSLTLKEQADKAHEQARELLIETMASEGLSEFEAGEVTIKVSPSERRSFDIEKLRGLISAPLFRAVTKSSVDTSAWDKAVTEGKITSKIIRACVDTTNSVRVLVRPTKGAEKPIAKKAKTA